MPSIYESPFITRSRDDSGSVLWSDYLKQVGAGTVGDVAASVPAATRYGAEALPESTVGNYVAGFSHYLQDKLNEWGEDISGGLSPTAQRRVAAEFGSPEFWAHPFSSTALTAARSTPSIAASAAMTLLSSGGAAGIATLMGTSGFLSAGETIDDMHAATDNQSDAKLREISPLYAGLRKDGISENQARKELNSTMLGLKPIMLGAFGGLTALIGPEAQVVRALGKTGVREAATGGILKRIGKATGEGFVGETAQTGAEDYTTQLGAVDVGLQPSVDFGQTATSALYGGVIGGVLGSVGGIKSDVKTKANPRPNPINPPAVTVASAVKPNQASVPARGSNTTASPPVVPAKGAGYTGPTSRAATIPGATPNQKKPKVAPNAPRRPAATAGTPADPIAPATIPPPGPPTQTVASPIAPKPASQGSQGDPTGLVAGPTEVAALNVQVAPTGISGAPKPVFNNLPPDRGPSPSSMVPAARTPSQVQQATGVPYAQAREVAAREGDTSGVVPVTPAGNVAPPVGAPSAPAPTPVPQVPAQTPGAGFGAGPEAAPVVQGRPSAFGGVEQPVATVPAVPVAPTVPRAPRILPVAATPEVAQQIADRKAADEAAEKAAAQAAKKAAKENPNAARAAQHGVPPLQGKQADRNTKLYDDADAAQALLNQRPANPTIPATEEEVDALKTEVEGILKTAAGQVSEFRGKVGFPTTPNSLVWLREAQEFVSKLSGKKKIELADKQAAATRFLDRETRIRKGEGEQVKVERNIEGEAAMAARGKGKGKVTEETVEGAVASKKADKASKAPPTAAAREVSPEVEADVKARYETKPEPKPAEKIEAIKEKAAEAAAPKPLPPQVSERVEASKEKAAQKEAVQEANKPPKARKIKKPTTIVAPKASSPAASSADFTAQIKAEVEPNPSDAQLAADNASKAHVSIEGLPLAIETAANTDRHIVKPDGGRISRLYKYAYGHILGTKAPDGNPIDIFLGPEAYPNNPKLEGLPVVVIDQVDPDTKLPDEPKVMYGFERVTDPIKNTGAVEAYKESYPRGDERIGDVTVMTPNEFKQWVKSKRDIKNAQEPAGVVGSELDDLIAEQTGELDAERAEDLESVLDTDLEAYGDTQPRRLRLANDTFDEFNQVPLEDQVAASRGRAARQELEVAAVSSDIGTVSSFLDAGVQQQNSKERVGYGLKERALFPHIIKRIKALAGDVKVYVVSGNDLQGRLGKGKNVAGFYSDGGGYIVINGDLSPIQFARTVLHEGVHAAFVKATLEHPELMTQLDKILEEGYAKWRSVPGNYLNGKLPYGLTSIHEILAEALSNPRFQEFLLNIKASNELVKELGLDGKFRSMWDVLMRFIGKIFKLPKAHDSLLSAVLKVSSKLELAAPDYEGAISNTALGNNLRYKATGLFPTDIESRLTDTVTDFAKGARDRLPAKVSKLLGSTALSQEQAGSPWLMILRTMDQIIQSAKNYGRPFYEHLRKVGDTIERTRTTAEKYFNETVPLIRESHALEGKYKGSGTWQRFVELAMEATRVQVYPDRPLASQTHLGKNTLRGAQPKASWVALNAEFEELKNLAPDLMDFYTRSQQFYRDQQNKIVLGLIKNSLKVGGFTDPYLAQRLFDETETEADKDLLGEIYDHIKDASELAKVEVYFPQMRRGNWVVRGNYKITAPTNALRQIDDNTWEFAGRGARKRAMNYAASQAGTGMVATPVSVWVDTNTGERYFNLGQPDEVRVRPEDTDAEQRFRVTVQNKYVSFHESKREAYKVSEELKAIPGVDADSVAPVVERKFNPGDHQADLMSHQMQTLANSLQRRSGFQNLSDFEKNQVVQAFNVASLRLLGSTRIQSKRLPRTNVLGASNNFTKNMTEYAQSTSGYLAKLDHNDELNTAMREARKEADSHNDYNKSTGQSQIMNVMEKRVSNATAFENSGKFHEWGNRLLATGFAARLISPAYNIINALQVAMVTYPALASRFGPGRAAMMLLRTYREVGVGKALKQGLIASKRTLLKGPDVVTPSIVDDMISNIKSPQVRSMLRYLIEVGSIDANSGIEVPTMIETRTGVMGLIDQGINYTSTFGRQMPKSIEAINRVVTAVASYNLEMQRSGNHDLAVRFAQETTNTTQGHYAHSNAAPIFNHPLGRLSFQFKKFPQLIYNMIGQNIGKAIANAEPGDRAEAVKTLAYMAATHFVMAGALGLPQEPLKWLIIGARQAGVTELSWSDVENYEREMLTSALGQQLGEIAARGITRALPEGFAFDLSSRVGLQDLAIYGEPRSVDPQDFNAFMWNIVGGAPAAQIGDWIRGSQALMKGDWAEASQRFSPVKMLTDAIKAGRTTSGSQKTAAGYEKLSPYSIGEAALRTLGFTPAREAETNEARSYYASAQKSATAARDTMLHRWADAAPSERGRIWGQVEKFNYGKAKDEKLTRSDLDRYAKRRRTEEKSGLVQGGFRVTKRDKPLYKKVQGTYSYQ